MYIIIYPEMLIISSRLLHQEEEVIQADIMLRGIVAAMPWRVAIRALILPLVLPLTTVLYLINVILKATPVSQSLVDTCLYIHRLISSSFIEIMLWSRLERSVLEL